MSRTPSCERPAGTLSPLLVRLIHAAQQAADTGLAAERRGHAKLLAELGKLALVTVPAHGVLAPEDDALLTAIEKAARRHLNMKKASRAWRDALDAIKDEEVSDAVEGAHLWVLSEAGKAYFYTGLAFAVTLADLARGPDT